MKNPKKKIKFLKARTKVSKGFKIIHRLIMKLNDFTELPYNVESIKKPFNKPGD